MLYREFSIGSTDNLKIDIFLYFHHLSAWYFIDIVGEIIPWSLMGVKGLKNKQ